MDNAVEVADQFLHVFDCAAMTFDVRLSGNSGSVGINLAYSFFLVFSMALLNDVSKLSAWALVRGKEIKNRADFFKFGGVVS